MKNYKRALRRDQKRTKYIKRLKMFYFSDSWLVNCKSWTDVEKEHPVIAYKLKTMSTTCSCEMCAYLKYNRTEFKHKTNKLLNEFEYNYENSVL